MVEKKEVNLDKNVNQITINKKIKLVSEYVIYQFWILLWASNYYENGIITTKSGPVLWNLVKPHLRVNYWNNDDKMIYIGI